MRARTLEYLQYLNKKINNLTILDIIPNTGKGVMASCMCICGNKYSAQMCKILNGHTKSCGCQRPIKIKQAVIRHGCGGRNNRTPEYRAWAAAKSRCRNINSDAYKDYGGRGIKFCTKWDRFENFIKDMGLKPSGAHSLDRIDNDGDYSKLNCRWALPAEQAMNRRMQLKSIWCQVYDPYNLNKERVF